MAMKWASNYETKLNTARVSLIQTLWAGGASLLINLRLISMFLNHSAYFFGKSLKEPVGLRSAGTIFPPITTRKPPWEFSLPSVSFSFLFAWSITRFIHSPIISNHSAIRIQAISFPKECAYFLSVLFECTPGRAA